MAVVENGKIIRGIAGFYYVYTHTGKVYECRAKGVFRNKNLKPLVGDMVSVEVTDEENAKGNVVDIYDRKSELVRPNVANADCALIVTSLANPDANLNLLDRFLIQMEWQNMPCIVCFNKIDIANRERAKELADIYSKVPYSSITISASTGEGIDELKKILNGKTTVIAGQSGAGKSTLVNLLQTDVVMQTGEISKKLGRGRHTTRHSELIAIDKDTFIVDTPGFSSIDMRDIEEGELQQYFPEILKANKDCFFRGCAHINEPQCAVKSAVLEGEIDNSRYDSYSALYSECKARKKY